MSKDDFLKSLLERAEDKLAEKGLSQYRYALDEMAKNFEVVPVDEALAVRLANEIHDIDDQTLDEIFVHIAEKLGHEEEKKKFSIVKNRGEENDGEDGE